MNFKAVNFRQSLRAAARPLLPLALLALGLAPRAAAQTTDGYHRVEVYGGYSLARAESNVKTFGFTSPGGPQTFDDLCGAAAGEIFGQNSQRFFCDRRDFNGFDASVAYNLSRYFGLKGNVTGHFKSERFVDDFPTPGGNIRQTIAVRERLYQFLGGVQVKDNSRAKRLKPFAHALAGAARYTDRQSQDVDAFPQFNYVAEDKTTGFALKFGGGLDVRAGRHLDLRVVEFDYNPVFARGRDFQTVSGPFNFHVGGRTAHNYAFTFGVVIH